MITRVNRDITKRTGMPVRPFLTLLMDMMKAFHQRLNSIRWKGESTWRAEGSDTRRLASRGKENGVSRSSEDLGRSELAGDGC